MGLNMALKKDASWQVGLLDLICNRAVPWDIVKGA